MGVGGEGGGSGDGSIREREILICNLSSDVPIQLLLTVILYECSSVIMLTI